VTREADVIEEILRIYGFNNVTTSNKLTMTMGTAQYPSKHTFRDNLAQFVIGKGLNEMMGMSLIQSGLYEGLGIVDEDAMVKINNTSNIHLDIMRPEMVLSGLESVRHNLNRQQTDLAMFEFGRSYVKSGENHKETEHLMIFVSGAEESQSWQSGSNSSSIYTVKRLVHEILTKVGVASYKVEEANPNVYDYGMSYTLGPNPLVQFGAVSDKVLKRMDIKSDVFVADFNMNMLFKRVKKAKTSVKEINKFPSMRRDLSLTMDDSVSFEAIRKLVTSSDKKLIKEVNLFDIYKNEKQLGKGKKSYAISLLYEDFGSTLNDKQVDKSIEKVVNALGSQLGCEVR